MKKLVLGILLILLSSFVFAEETSTIATFSVIGVYDLGPASDTKIISEIIASLQLMKNDDGSLKYGEIPSTYAKLFSEIDINTLDNRVTLLVYNGEAVIIVGSHSPTSHFVFQAELIKILDKLNVKHKEILSENVGVNKLIELFPQETKECLSGSYSCDSEGDYVLACDDITGKWYAKQYCSNGCKDGSCIEEDNYYVLHRIVKDCATNESTSGEQLIYLDIFRGGNYGNYACESRYDEHCILDGSFDTYYEEWCDYTDVNICGETGFCTKGVDDNGWF